MDEPSNAALGQRFVPAYDRAAFDAYVSALGAERERLAAAIDDARQRKVTAEHQLARANGLEDLLAELVHTTQQNVAGRREENRAQVAAILAKADGESEQIVADAAADAAALRRLADRAATVTVAPPPAPDAVIDLGDHAEPTHVEVG
jgi:hypothetical protein